MIRALIDAVRVLPAFIEWRLARLARDMIEARYDHAGDPMRVSIRDVADAQTREYNARLRYLRKVDA